MKKLFIILLSCAALFAYKPGDVVDEDVAKKLGLDNGRYVVSFFASWCHSCQKELPLLNRLNLRNASVIGVDVDEDEAAGREFQRKLGLKFKVLNDPQGEVVSKFNPVGIPAVYIIKNRKIEHMIIGAQNGIDSKIINLVENSR